METSLNEDEQIESIIEDLILSGALEIAGMDMDTGEPLYNFTSKMKSFNEELHNDLYTYFTTETMALWEHGFIEINFLDEDPMVTLTDKALNAKEIMQLDKSQQYTLKEIIRIVLQQK